jgi:hypothetical protein
MNSSSKAADCTEPEQAFPRTWGEYFIARTAVRRDLTEAQRVFDAAGRRLKACDDRLDRLEVWAEEADNVTPFTGSNYDDLLVDGGEG